MNKHALKATTTALIATLMLGGCATYTGQTTDPNDPNRTRTGALIGAGIGFLWFNAYPASVFMGDVGSLSLGGALGLLAVLTKNELVLTLVGGLFLIEALSVMIQVGSFKTRGKRVFKMAPIHHHFELKGWEEPKIIVRFWLVSILFALLALGTLKLR